VKDFERFIASTSGPRRSKELQGTNGNFDALATPIVRQAVASSADSPTHNAKKALGHLPVPHLASGQPPPPVSRHPVPFDVPQKIISLASETANPVTPGVADHSEDGDLETSAYLPAAVQGRTSEPQMGTLPVPSISHPHFPRIPLSRSNDSKAEPKPLVTPLTTSFAESLTKIGVQQATHKGRDFKLPPPPPPSFPSSDGPEIDPEITRGLGISPKKNQSGGRDRIGRSKHGFILSAHIVMKCLLAVLTT
jgi:hypothetical protein